jgi:hypothetical protein
MFFFYGGIIAVFLVAINYTGGKIFSFNTLILVAALLLLFYVHYKEFHQKLLNSLNKEETD